MSKSVEQKLFEAMRSANGVQLSAGDVADLVFDDAVGTRISNKACIEAGVEETGGDEVRSNYNMTWNQFKRHLKSND